MASLTRMKIHLLLRVSMDCVDCNTTLKTFIEECRVCEEFLCVKCCQGGNGSGPMCKKCVKDVKRRDKYDLRRRYLPDMFYMGIGEL